MVLFKEVSNYWIIFNYIIFVMFKMIFICKLSNVGGIFLFFLFVYWIGFLFERLVLICKMLRMILKCMVVLRLVWLMWEYGGMIFVKVFRVK